MSRGDRREAKAGRVAFSDGKRRGGRGWRDTAREECEGEGGEERKRGKKEGAEEWNTPAVRAPPHGGPFVGAQDRKKSALKDLQHVSWRSGLRLPSSSHVFRRY